MPHMLIITHLQDRSFLILHAHNHKEHCSVYKSKVSSYSNSWSFRNIWSDITSSLTMRLSSALLLLHHQSPPRPLTLSPSHVTCGAFMIDNATPAMDKHVWVSVACDPGLLTMTTWHGSTLPWCSVSRVSAFTSMQYGSWHWSRRSMLSSFAKGGSKCSPHFSSSTEDPCLVPSVVRADKYWIVSSCWGERVEPIMMLTVRLRLWLATP